jgi:hypothetical protein
MTSVGIAVVSFHPAIYRDPDAAGAGQLG